MGLYVYLIKNNMLTGTRQIVQFILLAFLIYIAWYILYDFFIEPDGRINTWLNLLLAESGSFILRIIGFDSNVVIEAERILIRIKSVNLLGVGDSCNGLELFILFTGFIICFPGSGKNKLWFIPTGIFAIHIVNSIRAALLGLNQYYHPQSLNFNHHYTFTMIVYAFIFYLWFIWTNRIAKANYKSVADDVSAG
jgi:exosortase family protein XrtF